MRKCYPTTREPTAIPSVTCIRRSIFVQLTVGRTGTFLTMAIFRFEEKARNGYKTRCNVIVPNAYTRYTHMAIHRDTQIDVLIRSVIHLFSHVHMDASDTVG